MQPPAFGLLQQARIVFAFGWSDFRMKYRGSVLGFFWSFIFPLVKFLVILHIFGRFVQEVPLYSLYLFLGIILWEHFAMTTTACMSMLYEKGAIIQKVRFPRLLLLLSVGWEHVLILLSYLCIFFVAMLWMGVSLFPGFLYVPLLILQATLLALGTGALLSSYALKFRDIPHIWSVLLQILFWLTPIMYAYSPKAPLVQDALQLLSGDLSLSLWSFFDIFIRFQPLSILLFDARRTLLYAETAGIPGVFHILVYTLFCTIFFLVASQMFRRRSRFFLQEY